MALWVGGIEMTKEKQNIAIAKACGWTVVGEEVGEPIYQSPDGTYEEFAAGLPHYTEDLNEMAYAEKTLGDFSRRAHARHLQDITNNNVVGYVSDYGRDLEALSRICGATAEQRAEAFLKAIGRWDSTPDKTS